MQAVYKILKHVGADTARMPDHSGVTPGVPARVPGKHSTWLQKQAMQLLRARYSVGERDLQVLTDLLFPGNTIDIHDAREDWKISL